MTIRILVSYHFHQKTDLDELVERLGGSVDLFADSGAYSAYSQGAVIDREAYATWLDRWSHLFSVKSNLDVIGDPDGGADNLAYLSSRGHEILPVFHVGEPFDVLRAMCESSGYVALGGLVSHLAQGAANRNRTQLMRWLVKAHLVARKTGTALHGFGCTGSLFLRNLPFYSADSSSHADVKSRCLAYVWDEKAGRMRSCRFRTGAGPDSTQVRLHARALAGYGIDPGRMADREFMVRGTDHYMKDQIDLTAASLRSFIAMEKYLRARHAVASPNDTDTGTKIYFVVISASPNDVEPLIRVAREGLL